MNLPLLLNHNPDAAVGVIEVVDKKLVVTIDTEKAHVTVDAFKFSFGNSGFRILESEDIDGITVIKKAEILEFSVG